MSTESCTPDVPDVGGAIEKATSKYGKRPNINFRPVSFDIGLNNFITFDVLGKILGKPGGMGYDICEICDSDGLGVDGAIAGSPFPNGAQDMIDGINENLENLQDQINELGDSAP